MGRREWPYRLTPSKRGQRLPQRLSHGDAHVFDGVMVIYLDIALCLYNEVEEAVAGEKLQHMVEKGDARGDVVGALTVELPPDPYLGLFRLPRYLGFALHGVLLEYHLIQRIFHDPLGPCPSQ